MSSGVQFEEDEFARSYGRMKPGGVRPGGSRADSKMAQWLIDKGFVKSNKSAQAVLLGVMIANIIIIYLVFRYFI